MADPRRLKRVATRGWLTTCCAVGIYLMLAARAFAVVTVTVETSDGVQGGNLTLTMGLNRAATDPVIAGAQTDLIFETAQLHIPGTCSNGGAACQQSADCGQGATCTLACTKDPRLTAQGFTATIITTVRPPDPEGQARLRLAVFPDAQHPGATFDAGTLATCTFQVPLDAPTGQVSLTADRVRVGDSNDDLVPGVQIQVTRGTIRPAPTPTPTRTITPTPTPTIPCFVDHDCPLGQVCDPTTKVCKPAPTPTPTIHCQTDQDCPDGLKCVANVCRDLSTPTPTPTPLPPCQTDADCLPGTHCRANVCVPIRQCDDTDPEIDRKQCRGIREACTNGACECGGDCNVDGYVFGNETSVMVCVLSGQCQLSACPSGDFNGDGQITGSEVCQAVTNLGLGCPAEGQPLVVGQDRTSEIRSLDVGSATGLRGTNVTIPIALGGGGDVATAQLDLIFDTTVLDIPNPATACAVDSRLQATDATFTFLPQTPNTPAGKARLRIFVGDTDLCKLDQSFPVASFDQGPLAACMFRIKSDAPLGDSQLMGERLNIGDPRGNEFGTALTVGKVTVQSCAKNEDCPAGSQCRAGACVPIESCAMASDCGTTGRQSCVNGVCECSGDCNLDGVVAPSEVATAVQIFGEALPVSACAAADRNADGSVVPSEVALGVTNFGLGCPLP